MCQLFCNSKMLFITLRATVIIAPRCRQLNSELYGRLLDGFVSLGTIIIEHYKGQRRTKRPGCVRIAQEFLRRPCQSINRQPVKHNGRKMWRAVIRKAILGIG